MKIVFTIFLIGLFSSFVARAQFPEDFISRSLEENDISKDLPSIDSLQQLAEQNSPLLSFYNADIIINRLKVISEKRDWMEHLSFEGEARYGLFDNLILSSDLGREDLATSTTEQTRYSLGVSLRLPLSKIADRKNRINIAKGEEEKARFQRETAIQELRQLVIIQYNNIIKAHRLMVVNNANVSSFNIQAIRAEKDFLNGKITIAELARLREMLARGIENFESNKSDFQLAYLLMQETVGTNLIQ